MMSEFARKQLEKYGWSEGKGLGKKENGIAKPIKAVLKFDNEGIGHNSSEALTSKWWCDIFNDASKRINITENETGVHIFSEKKAIESTLPSSVLIHKNFVKAKSEDHKALLSTNEDSSATCSSIAIRDEVLYRKCEGMKKKCFNYSLMKGKLNRIKKQDALFIKTRESRKLHKSKRSKDRESRKYPS